MFTSITKTLLQYKTKDKVVKLKARVCNFMDLSFYNNLIQQATAFAYVVLSILSFLFSFFFLLFQVFLQMEN